MKKLSKHTKSYISRTLDTSPPQLKDNAANYKIKEDVLKKEMFNCSKRALSSTPVFYSYKMEKSRNSPIIELSSSLLKMSDPLLTYLTPTRTYQSFA